jgi:hypothetical protein
MRRAWSFNMATSLPSASFLVDVPIFATDADHPADVGLRRWCEGLEVTAIIDVCAQPSGGIRCDGGSSRRQQESTWLCLPRGHRTWAAASTRPFFLLRGRSIRALTHPNAIPRWQTKKS